MGARFGCGAGKLHLLATRFCKRFFFSEWLAVDGFFISSVIESRRYEGRCLFFVFFCFFFVRLISIGFDGLPLLASYVTQHSPSLCKILRKLRKYPLLLLPSFPPLQPRSLPTHTAPLKKDHSPFLLFSHNEEPNQIVLPRYQSLRDGMVVSDVSLFVYIYISGL